MRNKPFVSVVMITYNHEKYIKEAIEGVLMQKCDFEIELIVANDNSPDNTDAIIKKILEKYPNSHWIRYIKHNKNLGIIPNFRDALNKCRGKYIAFCEGDDYWADPLKLQKQVDFLEKNNRFVAYGHNVKKIGLETGLFSKKPTCNLTINDFLRHRPFHTASLVINTYKTGKFTIPKEILSGDRALFLFTAGKGLVFYSNEVMAVYRKNGNGISKNVSFEQMKTDLNVILWLKENKIEFNEIKLKKFIYETMISYSIKFKNSQLISAYINYIILLIKNKNKSISEFKNISKILLKKVLRNVTNGK